MEKGSVVVYGGRRLAGLTGKENHELMNTGAEDIGVSEPSGAGVKEKKLRGADHVKC